MPFTAARLILWVKDDKSVADWYSVTFGWPIAVDESADGWLELDAGGFSLAIHGGADCGPGRWPKLQIRVDNLERSRAELVAKGVPLSEIHAWKHLRWCEGRGPEGHVFQLCDR